MMLGLLKRNDLEPVEHGEVRCRTCGEPHDSYPTKSGHGASWADRFDGHPYRPESWETVARRLLAELGRDSFV